MSDTKTQIDPEQAKRLMDALPNLIKAFDDFPLLLTSLKYATDYQADAAKKIKDSADLLGRAAKLFDRVQPSPGGQPRSSQPRDDNGPEPHRADNMIHHVMGMFARPGASPVAKASHQLIGNFLQQNAGKAAAAAGNAAGGATPGAALQAGVGAALGSTAGTIGLLGAATVVATAALYEGAKAVEGHSRSMLEAQRRLAQVSPEIARTFQQDEIRRFQRDRQSGSRIGATTSMLGRTTNDLSDTLQPIKDLATNLSNILFSTLNKVLDIALKPFAWLAEKLNKFIDWVMDKFGLKDKDATGDMMQMLDGQYEAWKKDRARRANNPNAPGDPLRNPALIF